MAGYLGIICVLVVLVAVFGSPHGRRMRAALFITMWTVIAAASGIAACLSVHTTGYVAGGVAGMMSNFGMLGSAGVRIWRDSRENAT
jgi:hypothetical protein